VGIASGCSDGFGNIGRIQKVQGKTRAFSICGICQCAMGYAKVEEDGTPGWQFDGDGSFFGYCAVDVVGLSGLRQFKQKFRPVDQWRVFSAEPR